MNRDLEPIDPDPWELTSLAVAAVAAIGTLVQAATPFLRIRPSENHVGNIRHHLRNSLQDCSRSVQQLIRFLARQQSQQQDVLARPFQYGQSPMNLALHDFLEYKTLSDGIVGSLGALRTWTLLATQYDPEVGNELRDRVIPDFAAFANRINRWFAGEETFGTVLDQSLELLGAFERAVGQLSDRRN
ncbi:hypothetical protein ABK249_22945 [Neorhizobium sp. Rsf11]|uniref:Uncharacterized protein n=1 Tax=Neorhizobium phenanthreniclasticum TaxID=3157917 RepID=A0ABV0M7E5_9HYPH